MSLGLGLTLAPRLKLKEAIVQAIRLTSHQRLVVASHQLRLRTELIEVLREEHFEPQGDCPKCSYHMKPLEILQGFSTDPRDYTTLCPRCRTRFEPRLVQFSARAGADSRVELPFYCAVQTLDRLRELTVVTEVQAFRTRYAAVYYSAVYHFGGLAQAFAEIGETYTQPEPEGWRVKVESFLGKLPDTTIAQCVGVKVGQIRRLRRKLGIPRASRESLLLLEADEPDAQA